MNRRLISALCGFLVVVTMSGCGAIGPNADNPTEAELENAESGDAETDDETTSEEDTDFNPNLLEGQLAGIGAPGIEGALGLAFTRLTAYCADHAGRWNGLYPGADFVGFNANARPGPGLCTWEDQIEAAGEGHNHATITLLAWPPGITPVNDAALADLRQVGGTSDSSDSESSDSESSESESTRIVVDGGDLSILQRTGITAVDKYCNPDQLEAPWSEAYRSAERQGLLDDLERQLTSAEIVLDTSGLAVTNRIEQPAGSGIFEVGATADAHLVMFDSWATFKLSGLAATTGGIDVGEGIYVGHADTLLRTVEEPMFQMWESVIELACREGKLLEKAIAAALGIDE